MLLEFQKSMMRILRRRCQHLMMLRLNLSHLRRQHRHLLGAMVLVKN
jgi:hypothetical protein